MNVYPLQTMIFVIVNQVYMLFFCRQCKLHI